MNLPQGKTRKAQAALPFMQRQAACAWFAYDPFAAGIQTGKGSSAPETDGTALQRSVPSTTWL